MESDTHQIKPENIERRFGLITSLNCVDENGIRCVDKSSLESQPKESREQSGVITDLQFFGIDVEKDLLKAVTGSLKKEYSDLGTRITGRDQVQFAAHATPGNINGFLKLLLKAYRSEEYKNGAFAWVDHIGEVKDSLLIEKLDEKLIDCLTKRLIDKIWLSVPELVDWERTFGFKYIGKRDDTHHDVRLSHFLDFLERTEESLSKEILIKRKIHSVDENYDIIKSWPSYRFLYAESQIEEGRFILNNGKWYEINKSYAQSIDDYYDTIPRYKGALPEYDDKSETAYNERVAQENSNSYALLDKKNIKISTTASPVEPCDLFKYPDQFIHVKRYGGSSVLSHLFNQGLVSGELFKREPDYREELKNKLGDAAEHTLIDNRNHKFSVVYAIVSEYDEDLSIPFFSGIM